MAETSENSPQHGAWKVAFGRFLLSWRWPLLALTLIACFAMGAGSQFIEFRSNYRVFFSEENPELAAYEDFQDRFAREDNLLMVIAPDDGVVFDQDTLSLVQEATERSWLITNTARVDSVTNHQHTYASEDADGFPTLVVDDLFAEDLYGENAQTLDTAVIAARRQIALDEPLLNNRVIRVDPETGRETTGVYLTVRLLNDEDPNEIAETVQDMRALVADLRDSHPGHSFHLSGTVMLNNAFIEASNQDSATLIPATFGAILAGVFFFLWWMYRAPGSAAWGMLATLFIVLFSMVGAMGMAGWLGIYLTPPSASAPTVIATLAVADSIHFLSTFLKALRAGADRGEAVKESLRLNFVPIFLTSLTTAIGFLSLNFSDAPPFRDLGNIVAIGVALAFVLSVILLPILVRLLPIKAPPTGSERDSAMFGALAEFAIRFRKGLAIGLGIVLVVMAGSIARLELNDEFVRYFSQNVEFRQDTIYMMDNLTGIYQAEFPLQIDQDEVARVLGEDRAEEYTINEPEFMAIVENFTEWLNDQPEVIHVYSIADIMRRLNMNFNLDDPEFYRIPQVPSRDLMIEYYGEEEVGAMSEAELQALAEEEAARATAQYLFMYENSLRSGMQLTDRITIDRLETRVTATQTELSSTEMREFADRAERWIDANTPSYVTMRTTGPNVMFSHISQRNIEANLYGATLAFVLIAVVIMLSMRSVRMGLISLLPNLTPALVTFGIWAWAVGQVNLAVAIVASLSLGIIVDDTIHLLSKYRVARRELSLNPEDSVRYAFRSVGSALLITTLALMAGFLILAQSDFAINAITGLLTAVAILVALIFDFLMLPAILLFFDRDRVPAAGSARVDTAAPSMEEMEASRA